MKLVRILLSVRPVIPVKHRHQRWMLLWLKLPPSSRLVSMTKADAAAAGLLSLDAKHELITVSCQSPNKTHDGNSSQIANICLNYHLRLVKVTKDQL